MARLITVPCACRYDWLVDSIGAEEKVVARVSHAVPGPYNEPSGTKGPRLLCALNELTNWHAERCAGYGRILDVVYRGRRSATSLGDLPFIPVRLFKNVELRSVPLSAVVRTLTSSGTSSQQLSKIYLDKQTAREQSRALTEIVKSYLGAKRLPMAVVDSPDVMNNRSAFSARVAGILGFSQFGYDNTYLLDGDMRLNVEASRQFVARHAGEPIFLFGFTFMVWKYLCQVVAGQGIDFGSNSVLIHGGGWKKLADQQVSNDEFKRSVAETLGIKRVYNYYGMVEQTGSIYMECEAGFFHASQFSDIIVRHPDSLEVLPAGQSGLLELMSVIPRSYPGHAILSEDLGVLEGEDTCPCGRLGKYFRVEGRLPSAELRGCSDTHQEKR